MACSVCTPSNCAPNYRSASSSETTLICSPARTGKTRALSLRFLTGWVHPHMCEENTYQIPVWICGPGSSPRVRGKQGRRRPGQRHEGLIPAHAGKTAKSNSLGGTNRAHPRACGENASDATDKFQNTGSSPRMRGKRFDAHSSAGIGGLIPAHAGKTCRVDRI